MVLSLGERLNAQPFSARNGKPQARKQLRMIWEYRRDDALH
jgi:hypothetical protein